MSSIPDQYYPDNGIGLSARELGTVLAALRYWQQAIERNAIPTLMAKVHPVLVDIATGDGRFRPLTPRMIDKLCERINR